MEQKTLCSLIKADFVLNSKSRGRLRPRNEKPTAQHATQPPILALCTAIFHMPTHSISRPFTTLLKSAPASLTYRLHFFTPNYHHQSPLVVSHQIRAFTSPSSHVHTNFFAPSIRDAVAWGFNPGVQGFGLAGSARWIVTTDMTLPAAQILKPRQKNMKLRCKFGRGAANWISLKLLFYVLNPYLFTIQSYQ